MCKELELKRFEDFPFKAIWKSWASSKVDILAGVFVRGATCGRILTLDNLQRRGVAGANGCYLHREEKNCNQLVLHCGFSRAVWPLLISLFGISWVLPHMVNDFSHFLFSWHGSLVGKKRRKVWQTAPLCFFWRFVGRDIRTFDNKEISVYKIKSFCWEVSGHGLLFINSKPLLRCRFCRMVRARMRGDSPFCFFLCLLGVGAYYIFPAYLEQFFFLFLKIFVFPSNKKCNHR